MILMALLGIIIVVLLILYILMASNYLRYIEENQNMIGFRAAISTPISTLIGAVKNLVRNNFQN